MQQQLVTAVRPMVASCLQDPRVQAVYTTDTMVHSSRHGVWLSLWVALNSSSSNLGSRRSATVLRHYPAPLVLVAAAVVGSSSSSSSMAAPAAAGTSSSTAGTLQAQSQSCRAIKLAAAAAAARVGAGCCCCCGAWIGPGLCSALLA